MESIVKEAMERGDFDDLPGKGKPVDLSAYFETPEDVRMAYSILKNAGMNAREADLLKEIAELRQVHAAMLDEEKKKELQKEIEQKQIEFSLMMERQRRQRRQKRLGRRQAGAGKEAWFPVKEGDCFGCHLAMTESLLYKSPLPCYTFGH